MQESTTLAEDLIIGVRAIALELGRSERQTRWLISAHGLPVFRFGPRLIAARRSRLKQYIEDLEQASRSREAS
jgi:hypothetical protein